MDPDTPNVLQAMMKLEQAKAHAKTANKVALEAEKEKDAAEKAVEELKRQLHPKRARSQSIGQLCITRFLLQFHPFLSQASGNIGPLLSRREMRSLWNLMTTLVRATWV